MATVGGKGLTCRRRRVCIASTRGVVARAKLCSLIVQRDRETDRRTDRQTNRQAKIVFDARNQTTMMMMMIAITTGTHQAATDVVSAL